MRTEEEQAEIIREWWEKHGFTTILAIVAAIALILGWRQWQGQQEATAAEASALYQNMISAAQVLDQGQPGAAPEQVQGPAEQLLEDFPRSAYADYASLMLARLAVEDGELETAAEHLQRVVDSPASANLEYTARIRLARLYLEMDQVERSLEQLAGGFSPAWEGQAREVRGDALRRKGDLEDARRAYEAALDIMEGEPRERDRVRMKLDDLKSAS